MAEDDETNGDDEPVVELGSDESIDGAPLARIASRLTWPQERSEINRKVGECDIRTPAGPQSLSAILEDVDQTYFGRRQDFIDAVREVIGTGAVPTE